MISSVVECNRLFDIVCICIDNDINRLDPSDSRYWLQVQCRSFDSDMEHVHVTKITDELCKLKANEVFSISNVDFCEYVVKHTELYSNVLTVQLAFCFKYLSLYSELLISLYGIRLYFLHEAVFRDLNCGRH